MTKTDDINRRQFERLERDHEVLVKEYSFPERGSFHKAKILDISGGGLLLESPRHYPDAAVLKVQMNFTGWQKFTPRFLKHFGDAASRPLVVLATVIRATALIPGKKYELATRFEGIDAAEQAALVKFIQSEIVNKKRSSPGK